MPGHGPQVATHDELPFESDMRARMTIALDSHIEDQPDMSKFLQTRLTIESSTSPKPCIVPGNALQLIDDDPISASRSHTPSSVIIIDGDGHEHRDPSTESGADPESGREQEQERRPAPRVRFRSRVRITSGLRRSRHTQGPTSTPSSSASGSPSSSISAPLRWQADESSPWGPLGNRLNAYARANGWRRSTSLRAKQERERLLQQVSGGQGLLADIDADERTPLNAGRKGRVLYVDAGLDSGMDADDEGARLLEDEIDEAGQAMRAAALEREKEAMFGPWPWRIFNRHVRTWHASIIYLKRSFFLPQWWWYHVEPIFCCCVDDSEYDDEPC